MGARANYRSIRDRYGELHDLGFSEVHFPSRRVKYVRLGKEERGKRLFVTSKASTPVLPVLYLGVSLTDDGKYERVQPGWTRVRQEEGASCRQGDWDFGGPRPERRPDQRSVGHRRLYYWPCGGNDSKSQIPEPSTYPDSVMYIFLQYSFIIRRAEKAAAMERIDSRIRPTQPTGIPRESRS